MTIGLEIRQIAERNASDMHSLSSLLVAVVEDGASIGFLPPLSQRDSLEYWKGVLAPDIRLWAAKYNGEIVGTVQLQLTTKQNGMHRAKIVELMVHPEARRLGIARQLIVRNIGVIPYPALAHTVQMFGKGDIVLIA